jgi:outer membrane immunogenic protein
MTTFIRVGIAAAAAVIVMTATAQAADMRPVYKAPPAAAVYNWTGCYLGGQLGGQRAHVNVGVNYPAGDALGHPAVNTARDFDSDGRFIYGGQIGCNWQPVGTSFVLGIEGDVVGVNRGDAGGEIYRFAAPFATDHFNSSDRFGAQGSLRARLGFAIDRAMLYVAGGVTWARISADHYFYRDGDGSLAFTTSINRTGWNIGAGLEYAFVNNWTVGVEYRYTDYGSVTHNIPAGAAGTLSWSPFSVGVSDLRTQDLRLRLNYLFGAGGAVMARY